MYDIHELNNKLLAELREIAKELKVKRVESFRKQDLIYKILDMQAIVASETKTARRNESPKPEKSSGQNEPKKRRGRPPKTDKTAPKQVGAEVSKNRSSQKNEPQGKKEQDKAEQGKGSDEKRTQDNRPRITVPKITVPKIIVPKIALPKITTPKLIAPKITVPKIIALKSQIIPRKKRVAARKAINHNSEIASRERVTSHRIATINSANPIITKGIATSVIMTGLMTVTNEIRITGRNVELSINMILKD